MKSLFVTVYMMFAMAVTAFAAWSLPASGDYLGWGGVLLVTAPFVLFLARLMMFRNIARTSARLPALALLGAAGVLLASVSHARGGSPEALFLASAAWIGFLAYAFWYSSLGRRPSTHLQVGRTLPDVELKDLDGGVVTTSSLTDRQTVWLFYRGNWCPLCMAQIKEIAGQYRDLEARGVRVALVSPQPHENTIALAKRFDVAFEFLTDENNRAAEALGIAHPNGLPTGMQVLGYDSDTVLPTVVITDTGGRVLWVHETDNYRVRPEPELYLGVLQGEAATASP